MIKKKNAVAILTMLLYSCLTLAQSNDSLSVDLDDVVISATRIKDINQRLPRSFNVVRTIEKSNQNVSIQELLSSQPSLFSQSAMNYAQDLRISMRGFGARSAFGIRGIKLIVDGVPETTPDGQGQVDNINIQNIDNIEILSGLSGGLYGNASGGVIRINSLKKVERNFLEVNSSYGSFETQNHYIRSGLKLRESSLILNGKYFSTNGYRQHAKSNLFALGGSFLTKINKKINLRFLTNYTNSPDALDPGGLAIENVNENRKNARDRNIQFNAGESIEHFKIASFLDYQNKNIAIKTSLFYHNRNFDGRLPFANGGIVSLDRNFYGNSTSFQINSKSSRFSNHFLIGTDIHIQEDNRQRFVNEDGVTGNQILSQIERFSNIGLYLVDQLMINKYYMDAEFRYDRNDISLNDNFDSDGDQSSSIDYNALNFALGLSFLHWSNIAPFIRASTNFETPTLSELSSNPIGFGFNEELTPTRSSSIELGIRGKTASQFSYSSNLFFIKSSNEILPFELEEFPGRDFFRNTGNTSRLGFETTAKYRSPKDNTFSLSYSLSQFEFKDYNINGVELSGNNLPGIPIHTFSFNFGFQILSNFQIKSINNYTGSLYADNQNNVKVNGFWNNSIKGVYSLKLLKKSDVNVYFGINNIFNIHYFDNIRLNAFGKRYYESGPERNFYVGLKLKFE